jgi:hypothetical protein
LKRKEIPVVENMSDEKELIILVDGREEERKKRKSTLLFFSAPRTEGSMRLCVNKFGLLFLLVFISGPGLVPVFAQNRAVLPEELWVCPVFESGYYSPSDIAIGGGAALGYGNRVAFGLKVIYWNDMNDTRSLELNFLARFYLPGLFRPEAPASSGFFIQLNGGPVIFARYEDSFAMPSEVGTFSAGFSLGWRFLFGGNFFVEPAVRAAYPYIVGAGLSAGVRF